MSPHPGNPRNQLPRFPDSFFIEVLRGVRRLRPTTVRQTLSRRAAYLAKKIESRPPEAPIISHLVEELAALTQVMEVYEEKWPPGGRPYPPL